MRQYFRAELVYLLCFICAPSLASEAHIENVVTNKSANGKVSFTVTLRHADKSWDHYANFWQVETLQGVVLAKRVLHHPHINEQPFTRSLSSIVIPEGVRQVIVTAGCTLDGKHSNDYLVDL